MIRDIEKYLPICDFCGEKITDETYYVIGGQIACHECCEERYVDTYVTEQIEADGIDESYEDDLPFC
jgi:recombinational DNA repair protein (RecF pathway)